MNFFILLSIIWNQIPLLVTKTEPLFLFGLYYGILSTLPLSLSNLLFIRNRLIEGPISGKMTMAGLIVGQISIIGTIYLSPLYLLWMQPHFLSFFALIYMFFHWYRISPFGSRSRGLAAIEVESWTDFRLIIGFFDSFFLQILNPILLPNAAFARFINVFVFRYSNSLNFLVGACLGFFTGYLLLYKATIFCKHRLENDADYVYSAVKLFIYPFFGRIILAFVLLSIGKFSQIGWVTMRHLDPKLLWNFNKPWPNIIFDHNRVVQPNRVFRQTAHGYKLYYKNPRIRWKPIGAIKKHVSQIYFQECITDGNRRISYTYPWTKSLISKDFKASFNIFYNRLSKQSEEKLYLKWQLNKSQKKIKLNHLIKSKINNLSNEKIKEQDQIFHFQKRSSLYKLTKINRIFPRIRKKIFPKIQDPRIKKNNSLMKSSPWLEGLFITNPIKKKHFIVYKSEDKFLSRNNRIKQLINKKWMISILMLKKYNIKLPYGYGLIPTWGPIDSKTLKYMLSQVINKNKFEEHWVSRYHRAELLQKFHRSLGKVKAIQYSKQQEKKYVDYIKFVTVWPRSLKTLALKSISLKYWFDFFSIYKANSLLYNNNLLSKLEKKFKFKKFSEKNQEDQGKKEVLEESFDLNTNDILKLIERQKEVPRYSIYYRHMNDSGGDVRRRLLKSANTLKILRTKSKHKNIIRFASRPDYRARLPKGALRSKRRKLFISDFMQHVPRSSFFIRRKKIIRKFWLFRITEFFSNIIQRLQKFWNNFFISNPGLELSSMEAEILRKEKMARWDSGFVHLIRGPSLLYQAYFRKYIKLPIFILLKNISRRLLGHHSEWSLDWQEWMKESYKICQYDGSELARRNWPDSWWAVGLQIKIIDPLYIRPWHGFQKKKYVFTYLTVLGGQEKLPFGKQVRTPSFWNPVRRETSKKINEQITKTQEWLKFLMLKYKIIGNNINKKNNKDFYLIESNKSQINTNTSTNKLKSLTESNSNIVISNNQLNQIESENFQHLKLNNNNKLSQLNFNIQNDLEDNRKNNKHNEIIIKNKKILKIKKNDKFIEKNNSNLTTRIMFFIKKQIFQLQKIIYFLHTKLLYLQNKLSISINYIFDSNKISFQRVLIKFYLTFLKTIQNLIIEIEIYQNKIQIFQKKNNKNLNHSTKKDSYSENIQSFIQEDLLKFSTDNLISQADILYKIWKNVVKHQANLYSINNKLNSDLNISENLGLSLYKQGLSNIDKPEMISEDHLKEWLKYSYTYMPASSIWQNMIANLWKSNVHIYWKQKNFSVSNLDNKFFENFGKKWIPSLKDTYVLHNIQKSVKKKRVEKLSQEILDWNIIPVLNNREILLDGSKHGILSKNNRFSKNTFLTFNIDFAEFQEKYPLITRARKVNHHARRYWKNMDKKKEILILREKLQSKESIISIAEKRKYQYLLSRLGKGESGFTKIYFNPSLASIVDELSLVYRMITNGLTIRNIDGYSIYELNKLLNNKLYSYLLTPDALFFGKTRREFILFNTLNFNNENIKNNISEKNNVVNTIDLYNRTNFDHNKNSLQKENKILLYIQKSKKIKRFIWPSYRLEDLACMNRFWFNSTNGTRFGPLRIRMYPIE